MAQITQTKTVTADLHLKAPNFTPRMSTPDVAKAVSIEIPDDTSVDNTLFPSTPATSMLDVRKSRMRSEEDVKLLANRLEHLKMEAMRAERRTLEAQARTEQIMFMKERNVKAQEFKNQKKAEDERRHQYEKNKLIAIKAEQKRHLEMARRMVEDQRKKQANAQREKAKKQKEEHRKLQEERVEQKRRQNSDMRNRERTVLERRDRNRSQHQSRLQHEYHQRVEDEARRAQDAQRVVAALEEAEADLVRQLEEKQNLKQEADKLLSKHTAVIKI